MDSQEICGWFFSKLAANKKNLKNNLLTLIENSKTHKLISADSALMMTSILELDKTYVRDIMIPRGQMQVLHEKQSLEEVLDLIFTSGHSRYPVFDEDMEQPIGILIVKDLLAVIAKGEGDFLKIMRKAYIVPESKNLDAMLKDFKSQRNHLALVMDEYGGISGLITIEDVIEEIVGEIDDEHDKIKDAEIRQINEKEFNINALMSIEHFNDTFNTNLSNAEADTIGGFVLTILGKLPQVGESVMIGEDLKLTVLKANQRRLLTLKLNRI